jgi:N6-L-threonylcarbamoyladenine synthase
MHADYGGVVPRLAQRVSTSGGPADARSSGTTAPTWSIDVIAYTRGPGLAGRCWSAPAWPRAGRGARKPALGIHHLEGHLLSPFLSADPPEFPFVACSFQAGTPIARGPRRWRLQLSATPSMTPQARPRQSAKLLGLGYPGGPALAQLAEFGDPRPSPCRGRCCSATARLLLRRAQDRCAHSCIEARGASCEQPRADLAASTQEAIVDVLVRKTWRWNGRAGSWLPAASARTLAAGAIARRMHKRQSGCATQAGALHRNGAMIALAAAMIRAASPRCLRLRVRRAAWPLTVDRPAGAG